MRRSQALGLAFGIVLIYFLFFCGSDTDFRTSTEASLSRRRGVLRGDLSDEDLTAKTNRELQMILDKQKQLRDPSLAQDGDHNSWASSVSSSEDAISVAGRKTMPKPKEKPKYPISGGANDDSDGQSEEADVSGDETQKTEDESEDVARQELQSILKKSPSTLRLWLSFLSSYAC